ncbi:hemolysin BL-binding protein [Bacillus sp. SRB_331]|nr:colicin E3/pyocin S6 family cytotoxin [Bacillus sp. SRB_331]RAN72710.1 hemolysin BL-binding protein [Bacillus sp. SRB_331]
MGVAEDTCNYIRIGTGKEIGQLIKFEDVTTGRKYGPEDYGWGTLSVVSGDTTRVIGKVVGKIGDLEKKGKALEAAAKNVSNGRFDVVAFDQKIAKMNVNEKIALIKSTSMDIAKHNGWKKEPKLTRINNRDVYFDSKTKNYYALDTQHGRFEVVNSKGKHQGEVDFNLNQTKPADKSGGHDLIMS